MIKDIYKSVESQMRVMNPKQKAFKECSPTEKAKRVTDYVSLVAMIAFVLSLFLNSWKVSVFILLVVALSVNGSTYLEITLNAKKDT